MTTTPASSPAPSVAHSTAALLAEKLRPLFADPGVVRLLHARPNIWAIVEYRKISYETRYSRMLRWLLDPAENHGLGGRFASLLLEAIDAPFRAEPHASHTRTSADSSRVHSTLSHVDVFLACTDPHQPFTLAIENKIFSQEHSNQLSTYAAAVDGVFGGVENKAFVFLTPDGRQPADETDGARWQPLSYAALSDVLHELLTGLDRHSRTRYLIEDFADDIQQKFDTAFNERVVHPLSACESEGGFGAALADLAAHIHGEHDAPSDEPVPLSGDPARGSALYEELRTMLVTPADATSASARESVSDHDFEGLLRIISDEARWRQAGSQDHSVNPVVQSIIEAVFRRVADVAAPLNSVKPGAPRSECAVGDARFRELGIERVRRTQGKGQGLTLHFAPNGDRVAGVYISGDVHGVMPNDPVYFTKPTSSQRGEETGDETKSTPRNLTVPQADADELDELKREVASRSGRDHWGSAASEDRVDWLIDWTLRFATLARKQELSPLTD